MGKILKLINMQYNTLFAIKKTMLFILFFSLVMIIIEPRMIFLSGGLILMGTCYSTASYEDKSKIDYLIYQLPITTKDYILSKYLYVGINTIFASIYTTIIYFILNSLNVFNMQEIPPLSVIIATLIGLGIFIMAVLIPVAMVLGFEKGRMSLIFLIVLPLCFSSDVFKLLPKITINMELVKILAFLISIFIIVTSYFLTSNAYNKKEI